MPTVLELAAVTRAGGYNTMHSLPLKREDMYPMLMTVLLLCVSEQMLNFLSTSPRNYSSSGPNIWTWASCSRGSAGGTKLVNVKFVCWGVCQGVSVVCQRLQQERERLGTNSTARAWPLWRKF